MTMAQIGDTVLSTQYTGDFILQSFRDNGEHRFACLVRPVVAKRLRPGEKPRVRDIWLATPSTLTRKEPDAS